MLMELSPSEFLVSYSTGFGLAVACTSSFHFISCLIWIMTEGYMFSIAFRFLSSLNIFNFQSFKDC